MLLNDNVMIYYCCALPQHITSTMTSEMTFHPSKINEGPGVSELHLLGNLNRLLSCEMVQYTLTILS